MKLIKIALISVGICYLCFGLFGLVYPVDIAAIVSIALEKASSKVEIRSAFGFYFGLGTFLIWTVITDQLIRCSLIALALTSGSLFFGRMVGFIVDGFGAGEAIPAGIFELSTCLLALFMYKKYA